MEDVEMECERREGTQSLQRYEEEEMDWPTICTMRDRAQKFSTCGLNPAKIVHASDDNNNNDSYNNINILKVGVVLVALLPVWTIRLHNAYKTCQGSETS